jgi:2-(1,2-epoxy-1,2-dihydrophenyl)acetyl-CoA isomerase
MTTTSDIILLDISDGIATVTLNRPERLNALSGELLDTLPGVIQKVADDDGVRCLVLTGAGRGFCAGGDIAGMASRDALGEDPVARLRRNEEASRLLHEMPKPTIAMINGPAAGAGLSLALACDIRIAGESARLGTAFVRIGFSGDYGGTWMLQRLVGPAKARELYFTGDLIDAREAERIGMVNRVVPDDQLAAETRAFAERIAKGPPIALARMKQNMNLGLVSDYSKLLDAEAEGMIMTAMTEDNREAIKAFLEKRPAEFHGR